MKINFGGEKCKYDRKYDREILQSFAEKFRGSLVGQVATDRLRQIRYPQGGAE